MALAERVPTSNERYGLGIIESHVAKGSANIDTTGYGVALRSLWAGRVDVNETNRTGSDGRSIHQVALSLHTGIETLAWGNGLLFRGRTEKEAVATVTIIDTSAAEAKYRPPHALNGSVSGKDDEISPGKLGSVLFLDWL
jgi:hypothetical protein